MHSISKNIWLLAALAFMVSCNENKPASPAVSPAPVASKTSISSSDLIIRNDKAATVLRVSMVNDPASDPVIYKGTISKYDGSKSQPVILHLPQAEIKKLKFKEISATEARLTDDAGKETPYTFTMMQNTNALGDKYQLSSGVYTDDAGNAYEYFSINDPVPAVVIVAAIGAGACLLIIGVDAVTQDCMKEMARAIEACEKNGGFPQINASVYFGMTTTPSFKIGCGKTCTLECIMPATK